jgi:hypothetical protein
MVKVNFVVESITSTFVILRKIEEFDDDGPG